MKILAVTGGIGSGKSYVINIFNHLGIPSYSTDERTKALYQNVELLKAISKVAGDDIISNGKLRKDIFASRIFSSNDLLEKVEKIVHPIVLKDFNMWKDGFNINIKSDHSINNDSPKKVPFVIIESAIFLEKPLFRDIADLIAVVSAPEDLRIKRTMNRDNCTAEIVKNRISKQWPEEKRLALADFVIDSEGKSLLLAQVLEVYHSMLR
ncbi:MAG: dephospho-CoA kinase [Bacteroidales bacterium]